MSVDKQACTFISKLRLKTSEQRIKIRKNNSFKCKIINFLFNGKKFTTVSINT